MAQYQLQPSNFTPEMVGKTYNIGLSDGTNSYGYIFYNDGQQSTEFVEKTDVATKQALVNYGSPNLVDRDLTFYPRVTQGDFSGGSLQEVALDLTKYFDADLEIRTPGYLVLRPGWVRTTVSGAPNASPQMTTYNNNVYSCHNESRYYNLQGAGFTPGINCRLLETDGHGIFIGDSAGHVKFTTDNTSFSDILTAGGSTNNIWCVQQGTNGRFLYYVDNTFANLFKVDLNAVPAATGVSVPTGFTPFKIVDVVAYQSGIAILTNDPGLGGFDVWYHDGVNMTRIVRVNMYLAQGITVSLGDLYVTAISTGNVEGPVLVRIGAGTFEVVVRIANPLLTFNNSGVSGPQSSGQYVAFAVSSPQINQVSQASYIGIYDAISGAYSHLGNMNNTDAPVTGEGNRTIAWSGRAIAFTWASDPSTINMQWQTNSSGVPQVVFPNHLYTPSGWMVTSRLDFGSPGVTKRFRRIVITHAPLNPGEAITVNAYVDQDQLFNNFSVSSPPVPASATVTNAVDGTTQTVLLFNVDTIGHTLFFTMQLVAGPNSLSPQTTPNIINAAVEVGGSWSWEFDLDCSAQRRTLGQAPWGQRPDPQGVSGKDLAYMLRNSYENGNNLTLYLDQGVSYTVAIETIERSAIAYSDKANVNADEESRMKVVLRQTL